MSARLTPDEVFRAACLDQAQSCRHLGSPLTAEILTLFASRLSADDGAVAARLLDWSGDPGSKRDALALRLAGALRAIALEHHDPALEDAYEARRFDWPLLAGVLARHEARILDWLERAPQTNEVGRSAVLIAGARFLGDLTGGTHALSVLELGCSAGLNLNFNRYAIEVNQEYLGDPDAGLILRPEWRGNALPSGRMPRVAHARGVDLAPLDPVADRLRLLAYVWADQPERIARLEAALDLAKSHPPQVDRDDAAFWLESRLSEAPLQRGQTTLVIHTIAWQYFPPAVQARCMAALEAAGQRAGRENPLARLSLEADPAGSGRPGAAMRLELWQGEGRNEWSLGRADFHGRWIDWRPERLS